LEKKDQKDFPKSLKSKNFWKKEFKGLGKRRRRITVTNE
jgi:hypothetical protein